MAADRLRRAVRERIRAARVARGWTQADLASRVRRSHTTVSHWETGARPTGLDDLDDLAEAFGLDPWSLIIPGGLVVAPQNDAMDRDPLERLEWRHPVHGRVSEVVCARHRRQVTAALQTLGIGCSGRESNAEVCLRCAYDGADPRTWIESVATREETV